MNYRRYIFLDIDGVLNHGKYYEWFRANREEASWKGEDNMRFYMENLDPVAIQRLNLLTGAEVVISSSWMYDEFTVAGLRAKGLTLPIIGGTEHIDLNHLFLVRGNAIAKWFVDNYKSIPRDSFYDSFEKDGWWHPKRIYSMVNGEETYVELEDADAVTYVIFDDSADMLMDQKNHFIHVDGRVGLTDENIIEAKRILHIEE